MLMNKNRTAKKQYQHLGPPLENFFLRDLCILASEKQENTG